jgi:protein-disulfide isomerase
MRRALQRGLVCALLGALASGCAQRTQQSQQPQLLAVPAVTAITAHPQLPAAGAQQPDVVIVEYMDYNCPYCRMTAPELHKLLKADPGVQIIFKEWPILGDGSVYAARSAVAASWQGKYLVAHDALIGATRDLDQTADVDAVLSAAGLDLTRLAADRSSHAAEIDALFARSVQETHRNGIQGTPGFLVGRQLITTSLSLPDLQRLVAEARADRR